MGRVLLLVVSSALALALGEAAARALDPEWRLFHPPVCFRPELFEQTSWGYRLHPRRTLRLRPPPRGAPELLVTSNAQGFRAAAEALRPLVARVLGTHRS